MSGVTAINGVHRIRLSSMLRPLWVGRLHGEKSDEMATQIGPQSPSVNRRITIRAGPTGSIRAALVAE
jgi:hypothetical protein